MKLGSFTRARKCDRVILSSLDVTAQGQVDLRSLRPRHQATNECGVVDVRTKFVGETFRHLPFVAVGTHEQARNLGRQRRPQAADVATTYVSLCST